MANIDPDANDFRGSNLQELPRYPPSRPNFLHEWTHGEDCLTFFRLHAVVLMRHAS